MHGLVRRRCNHQRSAKLPVATLASTVAAATLLSALASCAAAQAATAPARAPRPAADTSAAGVQILEQGGNAIDASIAANATLGLTEPMMNGLGGDLFAIIYESKSGKVYGLNSSGWGASGMTADFVASKSTNSRMPQRGVMSVTVPGMVAGWDALHSRFGTLGFDRLLARAIYYAENGFPVAEITAGL